MINLRQYIVINFVIESLINENKIISFKDIN